MLIFMDYGWISSTLTIKRICVQNYLTYPYTAEGFFWSPASSRPSAMSPCLKHTLFMWDRYAPAYNLTSPSRPAAPIIGNPLFPPGLQAKAFTWWTTNKFLRVKDLISVRGPYPMTYLIENYNLPKTEHYRALQLLHWAQKCWGSSRSDQAPLTCFERWCLNNAPPPKTISLLYLTLVSPKSLTDILYIKQWGNDLGVSLTDTQWPQLWENLKHSSSNTVISEAGYKVLFRWYLTPVRLARIYHNTNDHCFRGCSAPGTMGHIWWHCPKVVRYWVRVYNLIFSVLHLNLRKNPYEALMGLPSAKVPKNKQKLLNHMFLAARQTIAKSWKSLSINFTLFKNKVDWIFINEKLSSIDMDRLKTFQTVWEPWIKYRHYDTLPTYLLTI
uniref:Reverse transcriptase zinc-binding domain-containing protein n=1 Tax=Xenopus tropicalis TaxID=8364 RepID=A0A803K9R1_XENTR